MLVSTLVSLTLCALTPLPAEMTTALHRVVPDAAPAEITRGMHYLTSNEWRLETFAEPLTGLGGTLLGVGADQNYFFAGWSGAELLVLMDFDQWVVDLHALHGVAFATADTPEAFLAFWSRDARAKSEAAIRRMVPSPARAKRLVELFRFCRTRVVVRLERMRALLRDRGIASFVTDEAQYDHVASLSRTGRIIALRGDLTKNGALRRMSQTLAGLNMPVSAAYLSNAEQYFGYAPAFRQNISELPTRDGSLLLRTRPTGPDYTYCVQTVAAFREQLQRRDVRTVRDLAPRRMLSYRQARYDVPADPPMNRPPKRLALRGGASAL